MLYRKETSIVNFGDLIDLYYKIKFKGFGLVLSKLSNLSFKKRVSSKWDSYASVSDFWIIPEIRKSWNKKISGVETTIYEDYVWHKYLQNAHNLSLLSIGCGDGGHERNFAQYLNFKTITGVDVSYESIRKAKQLASKNECKINYICGDFFKIDFVDQRFDVILFNASLHHFSNISDFLKSYIKPLMKPFGIVVVFEYCGPNRLQWRESQLTEANRILKGMPEKFKMRIDNKTLKRKIYRPGLIRMLLNDPSEAPDAASLVKALHDNFKILEEKELGWNILHILLKDISHNFLKSDSETNAQILKLIACEEQFVDETKENDAIFGVYQNIT